MIKTLCTRYPINIDGELIKADICQDIIHKWFYLYYKSLTSQPFYDLDSLLECAGTGQGIDWTE